MNRLKKKLYRGGATAALRFVLSNRHTSSDTALDDFYNITDADETRLENSKIDASEMTGKVACIHVQLHGV